MPETPQSDRPKTKLLPRLTAFFFDRPPLTLVIWLAILIFGLLSYTTFLRREGFPSVNIPFAAASGTYLGADSAKVDSEVAGPLAKLVLEQPDVKSVQTQSAANFFSVQIQYDEGTDAKAATERLKSAVNAAHSLPPAAQVQYNVPYFGATGGDLQQIDVAVSYFDRGNQASTAQLAAKAESAAKWLSDQHLDQVKSVFVKNPFEIAVDPATGQPTTVQRTFDRFTVRSGNQAESHNSIIIGIAAEKNTDVIKLDHRVSQALDRLNRQPEFAAYRGEISASFAPSIKDNLSELQRVLLEGLLAILVVGSLVIAVRASVITVLSMVTVLLTTLGLLFVIGYTLNVITLFALILGLALIVDDTIIMVEAIDAARHHTGDRRRIITEATGKISRAMVAATSTAALSFAPLIFVGGILGSFIRAIPITLISALIISLIVALVFIPFFSRFLLLGPKQLERGIKEVAAGFENKVAAAISRPMLWARKSRAKLISVIVAAMLLGLAFIGTGLFISQQVVFNIFPPTKDTNGVAVSLRYPPGTTIKQAEDIAARADGITAEVVGDNLIKSSYYASGSADQATLQVELKPYSKRDIKSPQIVDQLQRRFDSFAPARVKVAQLDIGPPSSAFIVQLKADRRPEAYRAAGDLASYLEQTELKRVSGKVAHLNNVNVSSAGQFIRSGQQPIITVSADFDGNDTTTLVTLAQDAVKKQFNSDRLASYGLPRDALSFDLGQESENQDSFKTLALAFPILLLVMFVLLAIQFWSLLQPLLIFMAIPFSIFGVMLGLRLTNNAISFFTMLGFFALVGLSIKNTILLTDYANQARRQGMDPLDAAAAALKERFRPLFATSMTAVVSLIPLALASPFWEGLAVVLIFGLLSSTFLVVTVFPYYYLGAEFLRSRIRARSLLAWLLPTILLTISLSRVANAKFALAMFVPLALGFYFLDPLRQRRTAR